MPNVKNVFKSTNLGQIKELPNTLFIYTSSQQGYKKGLYLYGMSVIPLLEEGGILCFVDDLERSEEIENRIGELRGRIFGLKRSG